MQSQVKDSGATTVIVLSLFYNTIKKIQPETDIKNVIVTNIKDYLPPLAAALFTLAKEKKDGHRIEKRSEDHDFVSLVRRNMGRKPGVVGRASDVAIFQYTGGRPGISKAATATHQAPVCNMLQSKAWLGTDDHAQALMAAIPLFHVFGMVAVMCFAATTAAALIIVSDPRNVTEVLEVIDAFKPTFFD